MFKLNIALLSEELLEHIHAERHLKRIGLMQSLLRQHKKPSLKQLLDQVLFEIQYLRIKLKCWLCA